MNMRTQLLLILTALAIPAASMACGDESDRFLGDKKLIEKAKEGDLTCTLANGPAEAKIGLYAVYRCINSPVYGLVEVDGKRIEFTNAKETSSGVLQLTLANSPAPLICQTKAPVVSKESKEAALKVARTILETNLGKSSGRLKMTVKEVSKNEDDTNIEETVTIEGHTENYNGEQSSTSFFLTIKLLNGSVWSVSTKCPACG